MLAPGILRTLDLNYARFGWQERNIIFKLAKIWFISFAKVTSFKSSVFSYVFAKPTDDLHESFRLDREVLVLFTRDTTFEARSLDFVDKTIFEFQNRLDKLCFILISQDRRIREKIKALTSQEPETRLIVPFTYDEFLYDKSDSLMMVRLKEFFYGRDLFAFESPLQNDTYFFGRTPIVQFLYDKYKAGENSGLFGLRKIGKTSVLYAVKRYLTFRDEFAVFLDCQDPAFHKRRWYELLEFITKTIVTTLRNERDIEVEPSANYGDKDASVAFEADILKVYEHLQKKRILLIFDEIENISFDISPTEHWNKSEDFILFWQSLRSIFQKNPQVFSFIVAGVNPKIIETPQVNQLDNPIYRMITPVYLPFFNASQVNEMVSTIGNYMGLEFDEEIHTYLTEDFGGHPFLIRQVCSRIHNITPKERPVKVSKYTYREQKDNFDASIRDYVDLIVQVLRRWYPREYQLLEMLAINNKHEFNELAKSAPIMTQHLLGYNLVEKSENVYYIKIKAVADFVADNCNLIRTVEQLEDKWQEVSKRRNKFETNLRKVVKLVIKAKHGSIKGKNEFLSVVNSSDRRKTKLEALSFDQLFGDDAEIYFDDLRRYIKSNWPEFERIFTESELFEAYMSLVNKYRIDAHAKDISTDIYTILIIALDWLNNKVNSFLS